MGAKSEFRPAIKMDLWFIGKQHEDYTADSSCQGAHGARTEDAFEKK
jgi:hypothetical protein